MSVIYNLDLFDSERFEKIENPTDEQLYECIIHEGLDDLAESIKEEISGEIYLETKSCGFIDAILSDLEDPVSERNEASRSLLVDLFSKISEDHGRLVKRFGQEDPFFYGYWTVGEIKELTKLLTNLSSEFDDGWLNEFKDTLLIICKKAVQKNLGLIYSTL